MAADFDKQRQEAFQRWASLKIERSSWFTHWREISDYLLPRSGRFLLTDRNRGDKRHNNIYDSTGTRALRVLAAGLMAGMTSPARPWFRLTVRDSQLAEVDSVKRWLSTVTDGMRDIFTHSNTYRALHSMYEELGAYGTGANIMLDDFNDVVRHYPLTIGEYAIATDDRGVVTTLFREFEMTVAQMVKQFGLDNVSDNVKSIFQTGRALDNWRPVLHIIQPRAEQDRDRTKRDARNMPFASCYYEVGNTDKKYLRESGFKRFPGVAPRWSVSGGDIYGSSPGMEALGDVKQLQHQQLRKAQGIDFQTQPPLQGPTMMKSREVQGMPGGFTYVDSTGPDKAIRPLFEVNLDLSHLLTDIQDVRMRIDETFYKPLFLMLANEQRSGVTAREVAERHEEKLLMLGPVLERLHNELLAPLIDVTFDRMIEAGVVPEAPEELHGMELNVEFVSMLAQAQRAVGLGAVDRLLGTVAQMSAVKPEVLDKIDTDQVVDAYADMLGVDPDLIVADDKVAIVRDQRAKAQQQMASAQTVPATAQTAKTLSETDTSGKNALTDVIQQFSGYGTGS